MIRYFKKFDTRVQVLTGAGFPVPFEEIEDEQGRLYEWGVLQVQDGYIIGELENLIRRNAGGVQEISQEEYEALKKKEQQKLLPSWRPSLSKPHIVQILRDAARDAVAGVKEKLPEVVRNMQTEMQTLTRPMGTAVGYRPKVSQR